MSILDRLKAGTKRPVYGLQRPKAYSMEVVGEASAEIILYGDIVSEQPTDWLGNPIEGAYIVLSAFLEDLKKVERAAHLTVRIHSAGGNAYDAMTIHNRLKSLAAVVTVIVDGVAMSGGSLIMCAGDKIQVYPGSLVMIHTCWSFLSGGYHATELRRMADSNDAMDRAQAAIYHTRTGRPEAELLEWMEQETYMTGQEAVDNGFADELVDGTPMDIAASADRHTLFVGGRPVWASTRKGGIPAALNITTVNSEAMAPVTTIERQSATADCEKGGTKPMASTIEELRKEYPELTRQLEDEVKNAAAGPGADAIAAAIRSEQQRIKEIDEMSVLFDAETVSTAKYGDTACTAQEMTFCAAQKATKLGKKFLTDLETDTMASGTGRVGAVAAESEGDDASLTPAQRMAKGRADAQFMHKKGE